MLKKIKKYLDKRKHMIISVSEKRESRKNGKVRYNT